jgi:hypothetical protein
MSDLILFECQRRGVKLSVAGDKIRIAGNRAALSPGLLASIRENKADLISVLSRSGRRDLAHSGGDLAHS